MMKNYAFLFLAFSVLVACAKSEQKQSTSASSFAGGTCDEVFENQYKETVYPFFRSPARCLGCHIEGGAGLGLFASPDLDSSFAAFSAAGLSKIRYMATNPQHKPPYTGVHNQAAMDDITSKWTVYEHQYLECVSKSENGGVNESLLTAEKSAASIYSNTNAVETLTWELDFAEDLDAKVTRSIPARISIDVRVLYQTVAGITLAKGYIFSNPVLQLKDATKQVVIEGLFFQINGQAISSQTTYTNLSRVVGGTTALPLMESVQANTLIEPLSTQDRFQLYIRRISLTSGSDEAAPPLTPILRVSDRETGSNTLIKSTDVDVTILRDSSISRWCLSESSVRPASTEAACASGGAGTGFVNGWQLSRPNRFIFQNGDGARTLYLWVANQNLKINELPAVVNVTLDTQPPAAAVIGSINVTDTQVAAMAVSHANEADVSGWCVIEQNAISAAPAAPDLDDRCWSWSERSAKPTTVGFKEGGSRNVWVFTRDKAGNVSAASNRVTANNPYGAITYSQLVSSAGGSRAIFYNRCNTCHGSSANPGYSKLQLFNYDAAVAVADSGVLVSRINNIVSPMPNVNGGLMPQRDRDLIKLWTLPEEGDSPLP